MLLVKTLWEHFYVFADCTWTCACEPDPVSGLANKKNIRWMIRPPMPLTLDEIEYQQWKEPGLVVVFNKDYRVGDIVDWWHDSCFWTGRILSMNAANKVQVRELTTATWDDVLCNCLEFCDLYSWINAEYDTFWWSTRIIIMNSCKGSYV